MEPRGARLVDLLEHVLRNGGKLRPKQRELLEVLVWEDVEEYGDFRWLTSILEQVVAGRVSDPQPLSRGFEELDGVSDLLHRIDEDITPTGFDNWGEGIHWAFPGFGLRLVVSCESSPIWYALRPTSEPVRQWLLPRLDGRVPWRKE